MTDIDPAVPTAEAAERLDRLEAEVRARAIWLTRAMAARDAAMAAHPANSQEVPDAM